MRRQSSFTGTPASASFNTPTICSSLNRLFFMDASPLVVLYPEKLTYGWTSFRGAGQIRPASPAGRSCHFSPRYSAICCSESASNNFCSVSRVRPWKSPQKLSCRSRTNTSNRCVLFLIRIGCRLLYRRFCCSLQQNLHPLSFYTLKITSPCGRRCDWPSGQPAKCVTFFVRPNRLNMKKIRVHTTNGAYEVLCGRGVLKQLPRAIFPAG